MSKSNLVYALTESDGEIRYIGKSTSGLARPRGPHRAHCASWLKAVKARGEKFGVLVLEYVIASEPGELEDAEVRWIKFGRESGWRLTNLSDGGEAGHTGVKHTSAARAKIGAAHLGTHQTEATRKKLRVASLAQWAAATPDQRRALTAAAHAANRGKQRSPEVRAKIKAGHARRRAARDAIAR
jgi:hypothetical protein